MPESSSRKDVSTQTISIALNCAGCISVARCLSFELPWVNFQLKEVTCPMISSGFLSCSKGGIAHNLIPSSSPVHHRLLKHDQLNTATISVPLSASHKATK